MHSPDEGCQLPAVLLQVTSNDKHMRQQLADGHLCTPCNTQCTLPSTALKVCLQKHALPWYLDLDADLCGLVRTGFSDTHHLDKLTAA